jgi:hypothetical protein
LNPGLVRDHIICLITNNWFAGVSIILPATLILLVLVLVGRLYVQSGLLGKPCFPPTGQAPFIVAYRTGRIVMAKMRGPMVC